MLNIGSNKFLSLSDKGKLLLTVSMQLEKEIGEHKIFYDALNLSFPEDQMIFNGIITEIQNAKINYKLDKIKFKPPSPDTAIFYLQLNKKLITNEINKSNIEGFVNYFINFYQAKNWKVANKKMQNWKIAILKAANTWSVKYNKPAENTTKVDNAMKSYEDFMNSEF